MEERFSRLPRALEERAVRTRLGAVPALLCHPRAAWWEAGAEVRPAPVVLWFHGRTVNKELDPGRYLRWVRAGDEGGEGIAACAVDLPGHGERFDESLHSPERTVEVVAQAVAEVDGIIEELADPRWRGAFDLERMAIGGMSAGGMVTLRRLCEPHPFRCACVEATAGDLSVLGDRVYRGVDSAARRRVDPLSNMGAWRPIPLLALHSRADEWVRLPGITNFMDALRGHYRSLGADERLIELHTWESTGAPNEHYGFGRVSNEAKNLQVDFLKRTLPAGDD